MFKQCMKFGLSHNKLCEIPFGLRNFSTYKKFNLNSFRFQTNKVSCQNASKEVISVRSNVFQFFRKLSSNPLYVNTKVTNNVMLYRFEKPYMYKVASVFAIIALVGCIAMADNIYLVLCKDLFNPDVAWGTRLKDHMFPIAACIIGLVAGPAITFTVWYVTIRTMKYIILRKGGEMITFVAYHPVKGEVKMTVPLSDISCKSGRDDRKGYISIKIKNFRHHYMIDKGGHFVNPELFDCTVGVKRF